MSFHLRGDKFWWEDEIEFVPYIRMNPPPTAEGRVFSREEELQILSALSNQTPDEWLVDHPDWNYHDTDPEQNQDETST